MTATLTDDFADLRVIPPDQAAGLLGVHVNTLKNLRRRNAGPRVTALSTGRIGYRVKDIREWLDAQSQPQEATVDQQTRAALQTLDAVDVRNAGGDLIAAVKAADTPLLLRYLEAIEQLAYLSRLSGTPEVMLAALRERIAGGD